MNLRLKKLWIALEEEDIGVQYSDVFVVHGCTITGQRWCTVL